MISIIGSNPLTTSCMICILSHLHLSLVYMFLLVYCLFLIMTNGEKNVRTNVSCLCVLSWMLGFVLDVWIWIIWIVCRKQWNDNVWMCYCLNIVCIFVFVFQGISLIFKGNSVQISNFSLCICLGGAS